MLIFYWFPVNVFVLQISGNMTNRWEKILQNEVQDEKFDCKKDYSVFKFQPNLAFTKYLTIKNKIKLKETNLKKEILTLGKYIVIC